MKAVIVLEALQNRRNSYSSIASYAIERHNVSISEKTIRRHIELLQNLGYKINKNEHGFILEGKTMPNKNVKFGTSAYPLMILRILQQYKFVRPDQALIIRFFRTEYGCKVNRKAIGRNIKALKALGYQIEHTKEGYKLIKE